MAKFGSCTGFTRDFWSGYWNLPLPHLEVDSWIYSRPALFKQFANSHQSRAIPSQFLSVINLICTANFECCRIFLWGFWSRYSNHPYLILRSGSWIYSRPLWKQCANSHHSREIPRQLLFVIDLVFLWPTLRIPQNLVRVSKPTFTSSWGLVLESTTGR